MSMDNVSTVEQSYGNDEIAITRSSVVADMVSGLLGDVSVFLWLLVMGVNAQRWKEQASTVGASIRT
jgi:hypothetical protein